MVTIKKLLKALNALSYLKEEGSGPNGKYYVYKFRDHEVNVHTKHDFGIRRCDCKECSVKGLTDFTCVYTLGVRFYELLPKTIRLMIIKSMIREVRKCQR